MKQECFSNTTQGKNRENLSNKGKSLPRSRRFEIGLPCEIASKFHRVNVAKQKEVIFYTWHNIFCMQVFQACKAGIIQPWVKSPGL